jgi:hypothetical protein
MNRFPLLVVVALLTSALVAHATQTSPMLQVAPLAPQVQTQQPQLQAAVIDKDAIIKRLRDQNAQLRKENAELKARIESMTTLGGSEVHAYCSDGGTSRNTAGVEVACEHAGGFTCEAVSGLCRTSCQDSGMCAAGWTCDTAAQQCIYTSGGQ